MSAGGSGFTRALGMASNAAALLTTFALLPWATDVSRAWVTSHTLTAYGPENLAWLLIAWQGVLALLIFAVVRGGLYAVTSLTGLALAMLVLRRKGRK
ncbi:MAG: hypothetical protein AAF557_21965 [Pseudomonadota bacterium]